jgi:plasmid stability protein
MPKMVQIRNVPDDVHRRLKVRAAQSGVTLSEYLGREARRLAEQPTLEEMCERLLARPRRRLSISPARVIREARNRR